MQDAFLNLGPPSIHNGPRRCCSKKTKRDGEGRAHNCHSLWDQSRAKRRGNGLAHIRGSEVSPQLWLADANPIKVARDNSPASLSF